ncbi:MAG: EamA family transporter [Puniceicoccales bacterium]|nr:EamA family transporter [Puniceicoccales bacterium]
MAEARQKYVHGVLWFLLSLVACQINDAAMKFLSVRLDPIQTTFMRFSFAVLLLLPVMLAVGMRTFSTVRPALHFFRGAILFAATACWCWGLGRTSMAMAVLIGFSMPLILLILARIFLGERVSLWRWCATAVGFIGIAVATNPPGSACFNWAAVPLLLSATFFAILDIFNRRYAEKEPLWAMILYGSLWTAVFSAWPAISRWVSPSPLDWLLAVSLGASANLLLFCLMRALRLIEASATAPYRNVEFLFSLVTGYVFFGEIADGPTLIGAAIVLPTTVALAIYESRAGGGSKTEHFHSCC